MVDESELNSHRHSQFLRRRSYVGADLQGIISGALAFELKSVLTEAHMDRVAFGKAAFQ